MQEDKLDLIIKNQLKMIELQCILIKLNDNRGFMKVKEAALIFEVGRTLLYRAIQRKELKAYRPNGRDFLLDVDEVKAWIKSKT